MRGGGGREAAASGNSSSKEESVRACVSAREGSQSVSSLSSASAYAGAGEGEGGKLVSRSSLLQRRISLSPSHLQWQMSHSGSRESQ